jgi:hypothetical protein
MRNTTFFTGQPIFTQLLQLIPTGMMRSLISQHNTDHYYKKFKTYDHVVSMLYCSFFKCTSIRELCTGLQACEHKLNHLGLKHTPRRSTLSDANSKRTEMFFADLYHHLYDYHYKNLPDSRKARGVENHLFIIDSTTIKLFTDIMKGRNVKPLNGKQKGGAKAHVLMKADEEVPQIIHLTPSANDDRNVLPKINPPAGSILVFDKGYNHYAQFKAWTEQKVNWVTRLPLTARIEEVSSVLLDEEQKQAGILADQIVKVGNRLIMTVRIVKYYDTVSKRTFAFATNNFRMKATTIAGIYKKRWKIEMFFKRIKQHYPLRYFLGDSENAIKIQIWCAFIADLLIKIIKDKINTRNWSFANIAGMIRQHLMTYIHIIRFLSDPDKALINYYPSNPTPQLKLGFYG